MLPRVPKHTVPLKCRGRPVFYTQNDWKLSPKCDADKGQHSQLKGVLQGPVQGKKSLHELPYPQGSSPSNSTVRSWLLSSMPKQRCMVGFPATHFHSMMAARTLSSSFSPFSMQGSMPLRQLSETWCQKRSWLSPNLRLCLKLPHKYEQGAYPLWPQSTHL